MFTHLRARTARRGATRPNRNRLFLRCLEDRVVPALLVVTSAADSGTGSLRAILATANTNAQADTITFDPSVTAINLTTGQLSITENQNLTIDGGGTVTIKAGAAASATNRLFYVIPAGTPTITLQGLTLTQGNVNGNGGAINCGFTSTAGQLTLKSCNILGGTVTGSGGGLYLLNGILSVADCTFDHNSAGQTGYPFPAGGGIYLSGNVTATVIRSTISNNTAPSAGYAQGGGLYAEGCRIDLIDSSILNNTAPNSFGGGVQCDAATISLTNCTVAGNEAKESGGLDLWGNSTTTMTNCTVANNRSSVGNAGGMLVYSGPTVIRNCTIVGNTAAGNGGGIYGSSTISVNSSIIAANGPNDLRSGGTNSGNNNLVGDINASISGINNLFGSNQTGRLDPGLFPLGDYGGPTQTMALKYNSVAIDKGANPAGLLVDQRGQPRVSPNGLPDIGAVEGSLALPFIFKNAALLRVTQPSTAPFAVSVSYDSPTGIDTSTLDSGDISITGPVLTGP